ncbi:MAG TPA: ABC transporter ATP-binding protein [Longimicrobium sp.]
MTRTVVSSLSRWRALLGLLWSAARWRVAVFGALAVSAGLLPSVAILTTGALVAAIPAAVEHGLESEAGRPALLALSALVLLLAVAEVCSAAMTQVSRTINTLFTLEVYRVLARVSLGTPGVAILEDPALADELQRIRDADRRGVLWQTTTRMGSVIISRVSGIGPLVVLLAFRWWAPLLLFAGWHLANMVFVRATERGVHIDVSEGAVRQRRAEYLRSLVLEPSAAKENRVFGLGGWMVGRYADAWQDALRLMWNNRGAQRGLSLAAAAVLIVAHAAVLGTLAAAAGRGEVGAPALVVFVQAVVASSALGTVGAAQWWLGQSLGAAARVAALRDSPVARLLPGTPAAALPAAAPVAAPRGVAVRLRDVRFTWRGREAPTLDGLTLDVPAGQSLAIVGENGAGKSTLIKLLCGLYEPDAGSVAVDGLPPVDARDRIGVILQDFVRYKLTLRENVGFGHLPLVGDRESLEAALRDAGGTGLLERLPRGWDTVLSREFTDGADLSGGEWQRVALARALTAVRGGAGLLILDEPTASLDVRAETELFERFMEVTRDLTTILVSHRLSSVRRADRIVVIDGGRVAEDGSHAELMRAGGIYARMFTLQAERFAAGDATGEEVVHA